ncbi:MAG: hypothetical protein AB1700_14425 [Bacillota bacterium]
MFRAYVFVKRGLISMLSYRMALILTLLGMFAGAVQFYFMAKFLGEGHDFPLLAPYGGNLMGYLIIGTTFMSFVGVSLNSFQGAIRGEQQMGTLEFLLMSDTPLHQILVYSALWNFVYACLSTSIIFLVVVLVLGMGISVNLGATIFILLLSVVCMSGFGLMSAGVIMVTKQGDPITWAFEIEKCRTCAWLPVCLGGCPKTWLEAGGPVCPPHLDQVDAYLIAKNAQIEYGSRLAGEREDSPEDVRSRDRMQGSS